MEVLTTVDRGRIEALRARDEFFWLDLVSPSGDELARLGELVGLHEMAVEDTREFGQRAKHDRYPDGVLLVFWSARLRHDGSGVEPVEIHVHVSGGFLVTARRDSCAPLERLHRSLREQDARAEELILYRVLDALTDALFPVIDHLEDRIDALEGAVLAATTRAQLAEIYRLKQETQSLLRRALPQRDQFAGAVDAIVALPGFARSPHEYLRDVGDHLAQVAGELQRQTEDLAALTSTYFNANANRLNRLAARLTILATFFLIWTLVTSFFGQNFGWLTDHIDTLEAFIFYETLGLVVPTLAAAVYFWRRRSEWL